MESQDISVLSKLIKARKKKEEKRPKQLTEEQKKKNIKKWTTFYRRNWNLYASQRLEIKLHPFQHIILYLIGVSNTFMAICSRGLSKTFIVGLASIIQMLLYPYSEIHITSLTINQSKKMVKDKIENELCGKLSPVLKYMKDNGLIEFHYGKDEIRIDCNINGSKLWVDPADEQSRGGRSCFTIFEECRLIKKNVVDSVFVPMAHPRQAMFLTNPEYAGDERWLEECKNIYITSARFKNEWFWRTFTTIVQESYNNKKVAYNFFGGDIFLSMMFGLKTKADFLKAQKTSTEINFLMEDLNIMLGESENPFFTREQFKNNQLITKSFKVPTNNEIISNSIKNRQKVDNEYRLLFIDYAFANTTSKEDNDNTVIGCMYGIYGDNKIKRGVEYITTCNGGETVKTDRLIRKLFWDYQCDYMVLDLRSGGEVNYSNLTQEWINEELPSHLWNQHGFTVFDDMQLQVVPQAKIDDLKARTVDKQAIPCIIPIVASAEFNSIMWLDFQKRLRDGDISFLIEDVEFEKTFDDYNYTIEEKTELRLPYIQTMLLINEAVNLSQEWRDGKVKLSEPRTGTKDRIVACAYGSYIMTLLENKLSIEEQNDDIDDQDWLFLAGQYSRY